MRTFTRISGIEYRRKTIKKLDREILMSDLAGLPGELLSYDDSSFLLALEKGTKYSNTENLFENEKYYIAMKRLTDKEKYVLYQTIVEEKRAGQVAEMIRTTKENIWQIKARAIKHFLENITNGK